MSNICGNCRAKTSKVCTVKANPEFISCVYDSCDKFAADPATERLRSAFMTLVA